MTLEPGSLVKFVAGPLGTVTLDAPTRFTDELVQRGEHGTLVEPPTPLPDGWLLVQVRAGLYCPVHPSMVEAVDG